MEIELMEDEVLEAKAVLFLMKYSIVRAFTRQMSGVSSLTRVKMGLATCQKILDEPRVEFDRRDTAQISRDYGYLLEEWETAKTEPHVHWEYHLHRMSLSNSSINAG
jgi:hypothetical protein